MSRETRLEEAKSILADLGLPNPQQNERTALCLLALLNLTPDKAWTKSVSVRIGITPIMKWAKANYGRQWEPNTRETVRRQSVHQLVQAGVALYNPDNPNRPVNSPHAIYQIAPGVLELLQTYKTAKYKEKLDEYLAVHKTLAEMYAKERQMAMVPLKLKDGAEIVLSAGEHSLLIKAIVEEFAPRFIAGGRLAV